MSAGVETRDEIPDVFATLAEAGEFWDTHSSADYEDFMVPVEIEIEDRSDRVYFAITKDMARQIRAVARQQGISPETLVNLWLQEKLRQVA